MATSLLGMLPTDSLRTDIPEVTLYTLYAAVEGQHEYTLAESEEPC